MSRKRDWLWFAWPIVPAVAVVLLLANSDQVDHMCPPYTTALPPHPEQCLPTLVPAVTGGDPLAIAASWLAIAAIVYLVALWFSLQARRPR